MIHISSWLSQASEQRWVTLRHPETERFLRLYLCPPHIVSSCTSYCLISCPPRRCTCRLMLQTICTFSEEQDPVPPSLSLSLSSSPPISLCSCPSLFHPSPGVRPLLESLGSSRCCCESLCEPMRPDDTKSHTIPCLSLYIFVYIYVYVNYRHPQIAGELGGSSAATSVAGTATDAIQRCVSALTNVSFPCLHLPGHCIRHQTSSGA